MSVWAQFTNLLDKKNHLSLGALYIEVMIWCAARVILHIYLLWHIDMIILDDDELKKLKEDEESEKLLKR